MYMLYVRMCQFCLFRFQKRYMILGGIWFSEDKPTMNSFLKPIIDEINCLYSEGTVPRFSIIMVCAIH